MGAVWGDLEGGGSFTGDPEGYAQECSGDGNLSIVVQQGIWKGIGITGTVKD
jgi:hypothetical protein